MAQRIHRQFPQRLAAQECIGGIGTDAFEHDAGFGLVQIIAAVEPHNGQVQLHTFIIRSQPGGFHELGFSLGGLVGGSGYGPRHIVVGDGVLVGGSHARQGVGGHGVIVQHHRRLRQRQAVVERMGIELHHPAPPQQRAGRARGLRQLGHQARGVHVARVRPEHLLRAQRRIAFIVFGHKLARQPHQVAALPNGVTSIPGITDQQDGNATQ